MKKLKQIIIRHKLAIKVVAIIVAIILGFNLYIYMISDHCYYQSYSSVNKFKKETNLEFYDFYDPKSYFDEKVNKKTLTQLNKIKIYYEGDPIEYYTTNFDVTDHITLVLVVDRSKEEDMSDYVKEVKDGITFYNFYYSDNNLVATTYISDDKKISVRYDYEYDQEPKDAQEKIKLKDIAQQIIIDSIGLNK